MNTAFKKYLDNSLFDENFFFSDKGPIYFHWADSKESCSYVKDSIQKNPEKMEMFEALRMEVERLKDIPVWIKAHDSVIETSLFEIYSLYKNGMIDDLTCNGELILSQIGPMGSFVKMNINEFLNKNTFLKYIYIDLISGAKDCREFRLRCNESVLISTTGKKGVLINVYLKQITGRGILLSTTSKEDFDKIFKHKKVKLLLDLSYVDRTLSSDIKEFNQLIPVMGESFLRSEDSSKAFTVVTANILKMVGAIPSSASIIEYLFYVPYKVMDNSSVDVGEKLNQFIKMIKKVLGV